MNNCPQCPLVRRIPCTTAVSGTRASAPVLAEPSIPDNSMSAAAGSSATDRTGAADTSQRSVARCSTRRDGRSAPVPRRPSLHLRRFHHWAGPAAQKFSGHQRSSRCPMTSSEANEAADDGVRVGAAQSGAQRLTCTRRLSTPCCLQVNESLISANSELTCDPLCDRRQRRRRVGKRGSAWRRRRATRARRTTRRRSQTGRRRQHSPAATLGAGID